MLRTATHAVATFILLLTASNEVVAQSELADPTWQAIDYADGLVRVGVQSAVSRPETAALIRRLMLEQGLEVPPEGHTPPSLPQDKGI